MQPEMRPWLSGSKRCDRAGSNLGLKVSDFRCDRAKCISLLTIRQKKNKNSETETSFPRVTWPRQQHVHALVSMCGTVGNQHIKVFQHRGCLILCKPLISLGHSHASSRCGLRALITCMPDLTHVAFQTCAQLTFSHASRTREPESTELTLLILRAERLVGVWYWRWGREKKWHAKAVSHCCLMKVILVPRYSLYSSSELVGLVWEISWTLH